MVNGADGTANGVSPCPEGAGRGRVPDLAAWDWRVPGSAVAGVFGSVGGGRAAAVWRRPAADVGGGTRRPRHRTLNELPLVTYRADPVSRPPALRGDGSAPASAAPSGAGLRRRRPLPLLGLAPQLPGEQGAAQEGPPAPSAARPPRGAWRETPQVCKFLAGPGCGSVPVSFRFPAAGGSSGAGG